MQKVSVIIPIYNAREYQLKRSINSVLNQSFKDIELLLINDKSSLSETLSFLEKVGSLDERIKLYNNEINMGISRSRNKGIELASGHYLCFLDQDDYYRSNYIEKLVAALEREDAELAMCGFDSIDDKEKLINTYPSMSVDSLWHPWSSCTIWNKLYKRQFLLDNNIKFPEGCMSEDVIFNMQCNMEAKAMAILTDRLYVNVQEKTSTSRSKNFKALRLEQMPLLQLREIVAKYSPCNKYLHAYVCNEVAVLTTVLSLGNKTKDLKEVIQYLGNTVRTACKGNSLKNIIEYNNYYNDRLLMKILNICVHISYKMHIEKPVFIIVHWLGKVMYGHVS